MAFKKRQLREYEKQRVLNAELREERKRQRDNARLRAKAKQRLRYLKYLDGTQKAQFRPDGKRSLYTILSHRSFERYSFERNRSSVIVRE